MIIMILNKNNIITSQKKKLEKNINEFLFFFFFLILLIFIYNQSNIMQKPNKTLIFDSNARNLRIKKENEEILS